jgi:Flp pilus assembly protein TadD
MEKLRESSPSPFIGLVRAVPWIHILIIVFISIIVYSNSFNNDFVVDDESFIRDNINIRSLENIPAFFYSPAAMVASDSSSWGTRIYRPLRTLSYALDYSLYGLNTTGYHVTSLVLHILVSITLYYIILNLFNLSSVSLLGAVIFAIHPVNVEAVSWLSSRADLIGFLFFNISFLYYIYYRKYPNSAKYLVFSLIFSFLAYLGKESMIPLPGMIILYDYATRQKKSVKEFLRSHINAWLMFSLLCLAYLVLRFAITGRMSQDQGWWGGSVYSNFLMMLKATAIYLKLLLFPFELNFYYVIEPVFTLFDPRVMLSILTILLSVVTIIYFHRKNRIIFYLLLWFYLGLVPIANIVPFSFSMMAERFMYMPSAGPIIAVAYGFYSLYRGVSVERWKKVCCIFFLGVVISTFSYCTYRRNDVWQNSETLWINVIEEYPDAMFPHYNLGLAYSKEGRLDEAVKEYKIALRLNPFYGDAHNNLGLAYYLQGKLDEAIVEYRTALILNANDVTAYNNLGLAYLDLGMFDKAIKEFKAALRLKPDYAGAHNNLGNVYLNQGRLNDALYEVKIALELDAGSAAFHDSLGEIYIKLGRYNQAIKAFQEALRLKPESLETTQNLKKALNLKKTENVYK